jgi:hypothetical protein
MTDLTDCRPLRSAHCGNPSEAREHRHMATLCGKLIHEMELLHHATPRARAAGDPHMPALAGPDV